MQCSLRHKKHSEDLCNTSSVLGISSNVRMSKINFFVVNTIVFSSSSAAIFSEWSRTIAVKQKLPSQIEWYRAKGAVGWRSCPTNGLYQHVWCTTFCSFRRWFSVWLLAQSNVILLPSSVLSTLNDWSSQINPGLILTRMLAQKDKCGCDSAFF